MKDKQIIKIPNELDVHEVIKLNHDINNISPAKQYVFEFSDVQFARPYGVLFLVQAIREFSCKHKQSKITYSGYNDSSASTYLGHIGFFQAIGCNFGKHLEEAKGGETYIPIQKIEFATFQQENKYQDDHVILCEKSKELTGILSQQEDDEASEVLCYAIFETLRNAMEHSESESVYICGQFWSGTRVAEIAILDTGIGILESLKQNSLHYNLSDATTALDMAISPAVSSQKINTRSNHDPYANSGFGLYMLKKLCEDSGSLFISSNDAMLKVDEKQCSWSQEGLCGTSLRIEIDLNKFKNIGTLGENLLRYRNESNVEATPSRSTMAHYMS